MLVTHQQVVVATAIGASSYRCSRLELLPVSAHDEQGCADEGGCHAATAQCNFWRSYYIGLVKRAVIGGDGVLRVQWCACPRICQSTTAAHPSHDRHVCLSGHCAKVGGQQRAQVHGTAPGRSQHLGQSAAFAAN